MVDLKQQFSFFGFFPFWVICDDLEASLAICPSFYPLLVCKTFILNAFLCFPNIWSDYCIINHAIGDGNCNVKYASVGAQLCTHTCHFSPKNDTFLLLLKLHSSNNIIKMFKKHQLLVFWKPCEKKFTMIVVEAILCQILMNINHF